MHFHIRAERVNGGQGTRNTGQKSKLCKTSLCGCEKIGASALFALALIFARLTHGTGKYGDL